MSAFILIRRQIGFGRMVSLTGILAFLSAAAASCQGGDRAPAVPAAEAVSDSAPAGRYELLLCRIPCGAGDTTLAYAAGYIILSDRAISLDQAPEQAFRHLERTYLFAGQEGTANGCFVLLPLGKRKSYATIRRVGLTHWRRVGPDSSIVFDLYRSPDASYVVRGHVRAGVLSGWASESGPDHFLLPTWEWVAGRYLGPADPARCLVDAAALAG